MNIFDMTIGRIIGVFTNQPLYTLYAFICVISLCLLFQVFYLRKKTQLTMKHFIWVYIFLLYLTFVYKETGIGTLWSIVRYGLSVRLDEIHLLSFGSYDGLKGYLLTSMLNIVMMIPLGFLLPLIWSEFRSAKKVALTGFGFSVAIELSQIFTRRATALDDLVMNTLGAIVGCLIFKQLYKILYKVETFKPKTKATLIIIRNEAVVYLVCSFIGVFLFYNSLAFVDSGMLTDDTTSEIGVTYTETDDFIAGVILEVTEKEIVIEKIEASQDKDGKVSISNTGGTRTMTLTEQTTVEVWETDEEETLEPIVKDISLDELSTGDLIEITRHKENNVFIVDKIVMWKFNR